MPVRLCRELQSDAEQRMNWHAESIARSADGCLRKISADGCLCEGSIFVVVLLMPLQ